MQKNIGLKNPATGKIDAWIKAGLIEREKRWAITPNQDEAEPFESTNVTLLRRAKLTASGTQGYVKHSVEWVDV